MFTRKGSPRQGQHQQVPVEIDATPLQVADATPAAHAAEAYPPPMSPNATVIGKDFQLEGEAITIRCRGELSVNGNIEADMHCEHLIIGDDGQIYGSITADDVDIHGHVKGTINGSHVTLHETANVEGDINSQFLAIERGARFDGRSKRVDDTARIAPQLTSSANGTGHPADPNLAHAQTPPLPPVQRTPATEADISNLESLEGTAQSWPAT